MKHIFLIIACMLLSVSMTAQPSRGKFNPEEFKAKLEQFVTSKAGFTQSEAQAFYPIFHEMKEKQRDLQFQIFQLKRNAPAPGTSDKDYAAVILKITTLNSEIAATEAAYYKKMCKAVSARKVYLAMNAEDVFHRQMLDRFNRQHNQGRSQHNPNRSQHNQGRNNK